MEYLLWNVSCETLYRQFKRTYYCCIKFKFMPLLSKQYLIVINSYSIISLMDYYSKSTTIAISEHVICILIPHILII